VSKKSVLQRISDSQPMKVVRKGVSAVRAFDPDRFLREASVHQDAIRKITGRPSK
jgi:hypothetical protein